MCLIIICIVLVDHCIGIDLKINDDMINKNHGFYQIYVNGNLWLESAALYAFMNNKWYTTNTDQLTSSKKLKSQNIDTITYSEIKVLSVNLYNDLSDDFGGTYDSIDYEWITNDKYSTKFHTIFKIYTDGKSLSFAQYFPNGASNTNFVDASSVPSACQGDLLPNPILSFPSFISTPESNTNDSYSNGNLGWLTWGNTFSVAQYGKGVLTTNDLNGVNGGPVVLYDKVCFFCFNMLCTLIIF